MNSAADMVCELMALLSNRSRLIVLCLLAEGEKSVGELADALGVRETAVSQQLAILRRERIVTPRRDGRTIFYSIASRDVADVLEFLYSKFCSDAAKQKGDQQ